MKTGRATRQWLNMSNDELLMLSNWSYGYESIDMLCKLVFTGFLEDGEKREDEDHRINVTRKDVLRIAQACKEDGADWGSLPIYSDAVLVRWVQTMQEYGFRVSRNNWQAYCKIKGIAC